MLLQILGVLLTCGQIFGEKLLDLSYDLAPESTHWPFYRSFELIAAHEGFLENGIWLTSNEVEFNEHTSTHIDAPIHFANGTRTVDQIPLADLVAPVVVMDIQEKTAKDVNAVLDADDVTSWIDENGPIPDGAVVFVRTGWANRYYNKTLYFGTDTMNASYFEFPGIGLSAAKIFTGYAEKTGRGVVGVAIDTASLDPGRSKTFLSHRELLKHNIYGIENMANLDEVPTTGAEVTILPIKIRGGSGGPTRVIVRIPDAPQRAGSQSQMIEAKSLMIEAKSLMIEAKSMMIEAKSLMIEAKRPMIEAKSPMIEAKSPMIEAKSPMIEVESPMIKAQPGI